MSWLLSLSLREYRSNQDRYGVDGRLVHTEEHGRCEWRHVVYSVGDIRLSRRHDVPIDARNEQSEYLVLEV